MANFPGGFAYIDFEGQIISTTPITVPGAHALVKTGKPVIFGNIVMEATIPPVTVCVSMATWDNDDPDAPYIALFGETAIYISAEDSVYLPE